MENNWQSMVSVIPWLSWREYYLSSGKKTLIFEQRSHAYYLLSDKADEAWCSCQTGRLAGQRFT